MTSRGEIARQDELRLAGHRLLVDHVAVDDVLVGVGAQDRCCRGPMTSTRDSDWYFGRNHHDDHESDERHDECWAQISTLLRQSAAPRAAKSNSASMNGPRRNGWADDDAKLISRLRTEENQTPASITID